MNTAEQEIEKAVATRLQDIIGRLVIENTTLRVQLETLVKEVKNGESRGDKI